jgi:hypothetical protein
MDFELQSREQEENKNLDFDPSLINLLTLTIDKEKFRTKLKRLETEEAKTEAKERMLEVFSKEISQKDIDEIFCFPEEGIESQTLICPVNKDREKNAIETLSIIYSGEKSRYAGMANFYFSKRDDKSSLYVILRELVNQGKGLGLDIECRLENFCRKNGIWEIKNNAATWPMKNASRPLVGAYVWARCGYEFDNLEEARTLIGSLEDYLRRHEIEPAIKLSKIKRPVDMATLKGKDRRGRVVDAGKMFLTSCPVEWHGRRDLRLDSQGTSDFVRYLRERSRNDLIEKYYNDFRVDGE